MKIKVLSIITLALSMAILADDFKLDPAPLKIHGVVSSQSGIQFPWLAETIRGKSDLEALIKVQTPVKSQGRRGTCSIFSAAGEVESLLKTRNGKEYDLSENYLEYLVQTRVKWSPSAGSDTQWNIPAFKKHGAVFETDFPYDIYDWTESDIPAEEKARAEKTCGHLTGKNKTACLFGHMDPNNDQFARVAKAVQSELELGQLRFEVLSTQTEIKNALKQNKPLLLGIRFFYKAWNHRKMVEYGLGERDMEAWARGEVGTPDAKDLKVSEEHSAGHSIVVVGYDDAKQVYFFKNSWGTGSFGEKSDLLGTGTTDGYGTVTYEYAHNYGTFHQVEFK